MLLLVAFSIVLAFILRSPEFSAVSIPELSRLIQIPAVRAYLDSILDPRYPPGFFENLLQRVFNYGDWAAYELSPKSLALGSRARYLLVGSSLDVSVIVPTWNEERYLPRCLHSLRRQTRGRPKEVIVVDGGSTDRTVEIAGRWADKVLIEPDKPVGAARNIGAEEARGDILAFIDADTFACPDWLSAIERALSSNAGTVGVTGPTLPHDGRPIDVVTYRLWTIYLQRILLRTGMPHVIGFNCAYRREPFRLVGGFDEVSVMSEDIRLAQKIRKHGNIAYEKGMWALTSARRFRRYGNFYIASLYVLNGFSTITLNKSHSHYPPVR
jgi:glycosyltransferase involved in cell wall biosynthesis